MILREWSPQIAQQLLTCVQEFIDETGFPVTFSREKAYETLFFAYQDPESDIILSVQDGEIAGGAIVCYVQEWHEERFGYVTKFFIRPKYRQAGLGRGVAAELSEWFDKKLCVCSFVTSTANIGAGRLFTNLMAKYGYQDCGPTLVREKDHGKRKM